MMKDGIGNKIITEGTITNGLSRETGNIGHKTQATLGVCITLLSLRDHMCCSSFYFFVLSFFYLFVFGLCLVPNVACVLCPMLPVSCALCCRCLVPNVACVLCPMLPVSCAQCLCLLSTNLLSRACLKNILILSFKKLSGKYEHLVER
jgi:hypothetical protein